MDPYVQFGINKTEKNIYIYIYIYICFLEKKERGKGRKIYLRYTQNTSLRNHAITFPVLPGIVQAAKGIQMKKKTIMDS